MPTSQPWSASPPATSGLYLGRQVSARHIEHVCRATRYDDGSLEIHNEHGDTIDNWSDYEFAGPIDD